MVLKFFVGPIKIERPLTLYGVHSSFRGPVPFTEALGYKDRTLDRNMSRGRTRN